MMTDLLATTRMQRPRTLVHPGPFEPVRIRTMHAAKARHFRLHLAPGLSLFDALVGPLYAAGVEAASTTILGGHFSQLNYCVAPPDPTGQAVIAYTDAIDGGAATMIFGNATLGKNLSGEPIVHCHAAFRCEQGAIKGGHILTNTSIIGSQPITVLVTTLDGFDLRVAFDAETNISLLQPQAKKPTGTPS